MAGKPSKKAPGRRLSADQVKTLADARKRAAAERAEQLGRERAAASSDRAELDRLRAQVGAGAGVPPSSAAAASAPPPLAQDDVGSHERQAGPELPSSAAKAEAIALERRPGMAKLKKVLEREPTTPLELAKCLALIGRTLGTVLHKSWICSDPDGTLHPRVIDAANDMWPLVVEMGWDWVTGLITKLLFVSGCMTFAGGPLLETVKMFWNGEPPRALLLMQGRDQEWPRRDPSPGGASNAGSPAPAAPATPHLRAVTNPPAAITGMPDLAAAAKLAAELPPEMRGVVGDELRRFADQLSGPPAPQQPATTPAKEAS